MDSFFDFIPDKLKNRLKIDDEIKTTIPISIMREHSIFPFEKKQDTLFLATLDLDNIIIFEDLKRLTNAKLKVFKVNQSIFDFYFKQFSEKEYIDSALAEFNKEYNVTKRNNNNALSDDNTNILDAPIVKLTDTIIKQAIEKKASDIHIEPTDNILRIRYRIDGILSVAESFPNSIYFPLINRIKYLGNLDTSQRHIPQDGRTEVEINGEKIDIRISLFPTIYGEKCVLRILSREYFLLNKDALGFSKQNIKYFNKLLNLNRGLILVSGPTGSGKTTTLYSMLNEINDDADNIMTIEDPVECKIDGINQFQINPKSGMNFANSLRSILRQDPDIIMVGEIRDVDTAKLSVRAAITGHLVLSTIHTHSAISTIYRLIDMDIESYLLSDALMGITSQRLIRILCDNCKKQSIPRKEDSLLLNINSNAVWYEPRGCHLCNYSGYRGRRAIHEIIFIDKTIRNMILNKSPSNLILDYLYKNNFVSLKNHVIDLLNDGITSFEEVKKIIFSLE